MPLVEPDPESPPTHKNSRPVSSRLQPGATYRPAVITERYGVLDDLLASPFDHLSSHCRMPSHVLEDEEDFARRGQLEEEELPMDDDDDDFGRGNVSPLSSPMSTRRCQSIVEPLEDRFSTRTASKAGGSRAGGSAAQEDAPDVAEMHDEFDENSWSWKERAQAAEQQLSSREEQLEVQLTAREDANKRLLAELAKKNDENAKLRARITEMTEHAMKKEQECHSVAAWLQERRNGILSQRSSANSIQATGQ